MKTSELVEQLAIELYKNHTPERIVYREDTDRKQLSTASLPIQRTLLRWLLDNEITLKD